MPCDLCATKMACDIQCCLAGLVALLIVLYVLVKTFPKQAKKLEKKGSAWLMSKIMWRVHAKVSEQKKILFKIVDQFKSNPHILEIGVGPGCNLAFLPKGTNLDCLEPNEEHKKYLLKALEKHPDIHLNRFVKGIAEDMATFESNTYDAVICTMVLCSVRNPEKALSEVKRVLKPEGYFLFLEHVGSPKQGFLRSVQNGLNRIWPLLSDGCQLTRETWKTVDNAGFSQVKQEHFNMNMMFVPFLKSALYGHAVK